jgi:phosphoglycerate dehydrogenase-like enzyme
MTRVAILDDYVHSALISADWSRLPPEVDIQVFGQPFADAGEAAERLAGYEIIVAMRERTAFDAELIKRLSGLRLLITTGMRNNSIDMEFCRKRGIPVCGTRSVKREMASTTELAWAHILALTKNLGRAGQDIRAGRWQTSLAGTVSGKTLGLLGLGKLGGQMALIGQAFSMKVMAWSQNLDRGNAGKMGVLPVGKQDLFAKSDFVSLHVVLSSRTRNVVGRKELNLMQPSAFLINTARAGLVDQKALVAALKEGRIAGAGIDVYAKEPISPDDPLLTLENVSLSPHLGYATGENFEVYYHDVVEDISAWLAGEPVRVLN